MTSTRSAPRLLLSAAALAAMLLVAGPAAAENAVVAPDGTLYEVFQARYDEIIPTPEGSAVARVPVLGLRITPSEGEPRLELIDGTVDEDIEGSISVELEETTGTLFLAYTKTTGIMADMHIAVRRDGVWLGQDILSNRGLYLSINPKVAVTRQQYVAFDSEGNPVTKNRSIFSLVWWEESGPSQARYAPIFVEDGALRIDAVEPWNLNELAGTPGITDTGGLPISAFSYPAVQADPATNGGVLVTFANLVTRTQQVLRITFIDDLTKLVPPGATRVTDEAWARSHVPIGRSVGTGRIPAVMNTLSAVGAVASQRGVTTFYWVEGNTLRFVRSSDGEAAAPRSLALKSNFSEEKALRLVRALAEKN